MMRLRTSPQATGSGRGAAAIALGAAAVLALLAVPVSAQIVNEATAVGTHAGGPVTSNTSSVSVPVAPPRQVLTVSVAETRFDPGATGGPDLDAGDTLTVVVSVRNEGNVTLDDVVAEPRSIDFNGRPHDAARLRLEAGAPVRLAPGAEQSFTFVYELADDDIHAAAGINNGVATSWGARASGRVPEIAVTAGSASATIAAVPRLTIAKSFAITTDAGLIGSADAGDIITYTYVVTNSGNVALSGVHIVDAHEGDEDHGTLLDSGTYAGPLGDGPGQWNLSETTPATFGANADADTSDAVFDTLGVGGVVTFTYTHQVTQAEFDAQ